MYKNFWSIERWFWLLEINQMYWQLNCNGLQLIELILRLKRWLVISIRQLLLIKSKLWPIRGKNLSRLNKRVVLSNSYLNKQLLNWLPNYLLKTSTKYLKQYNMKISRVSIFMNLIRALKMQLNFITKNTVRS